MKCKGIKKYAAINSELACENKTVDSPFDYTDDMHNHECHEVIIIFDGDIGFFTEYTGHEMKRGDVAFIPNYVFHAATIYDPSIYDRAVINVDDNALRRSSSPSLNLLSCFEPYNDANLHTIHLDDDELEEIKSYCINLQKNLKAAKPGTDIMADAYLKLIMTKLTLKYNNSPTMNLPNIMPEIVKKTFEYIDRHLTEEITLSTLEEAIHHNGTYISRCVKKFSGLSIQQYIIAKKIALACKLLREGYSPSDACFMSGFNNYSNFSRTFAKNVGKSPKQLQMANRTIL
ncbi:AraC family transcriptional regulator [Butyrivibrio sp. WCD3002]|uniref:AraC family transcriptional regulator n=1 Tax=Butyrivibrio sp. WCD3002 TaxID=1280676 RepID=UPI0004023A02|nr:AraC family transcriptional regulator [Butyrivibrio sp. WCD3002]